MRAFSVRQPWAHLIAHGGNTTANRNRPTDYRGPVAVHAGRTFAVADYEWARHRWGPGLVPDRERLAFGAVIALAHLSDCHTAEDCTADACAPWGETAPRLHHWVLTDTQPLASPISAQGRLGLWTPDRDLAAAIDAAERN
ncbi:hypothetical protein GCM10027447_01980 [Glycomyces halotolerans]